MIVDDDRHGKGKVAVVKDNRAWVANRHVVDMEVESSQADRRMIARVGRIHSQNGIRRRLEDTSLLRSQDRDIRGVGFFLCL